MFLQVINGKGPIISLVSGYLIKLLVLIKTNKAFSCACIVLENYLIMGGFGSINKLYRKLNTYRAFARLSPIARVSTLPLCSNKLLREPWVPGGAGGV